MKKENSGTPAAAPGPSAAKPGAAEPDRPAPNGPVAGAPPAAAAGGPSPQTAEELYNQLLRLKAEFENYRRRIDRERPEWIRSGEAGVWERLLPVYDVLARAHELVLKQAAGEGSGTKELAQGLELVFKEFTKIFESGGVRAIEAVGKPYDHDLHEVLGAVETAAQPEGTVLEEIQRGYLLQGKILRPSRVRIAKKKS